MALSSKSGLCHLLFTECKCRCRSQHSADQRFAGAANDVQKICKNTRPCRSKDAKAHVGTDASVTNKQINKSGISKPRRTPAIHMVTKTYQPPVQKGLPRLAASGLGDCGHCPLAAQVQRSAAHGGADAGAQPAGHDEGVAVPVGADETLTSVQYLSIILWYL